MYTGTLINELMAVVERTEARVRTNERDSELERWYASQHSTVVVDAELLGVA
jgi:thiamine biosynthesis lipoprotein ApbE